MHDIMSLYNILEEILFYKICYYDYETGILFSMLCKKFNMISKGYGNDKRDIKDYFLKCIDNDGKIYYVDKNTGIKNGKYMEMIKIDNVFRNEIVKVKECIYLNGNLYGIYNTWTEYGKKKIETFYKHDKLHGNYIKYRYGSIYIKCNYNNGILDGKYTKPGRLEYNYNNGILDGKYIEWNTNGEIGLQCNYNNGLLHGIYTEWNMNGKIVLQCNYNNGVLYGKYYINKKRRNNPIYIIECEYNNGKFHGHYASYHKNLKHYVNCNYDNGILNGTYIKYYNNGNKWIECKYINGVLDDEYKEWGQHGQLQQHSRYKNGIIIQYYMIGVNMERNICRIDGLWDE